MDDVVTLLFQKEFSKSEGDVSRKSTFRKMWFFASFCNFFNLRFYDGFIESTEFLLKRFRI